jgi:hypothetical protein|nr:hypothetical protein 7 [Desulfobacterales bacterium]
MTRINTPNTRHLFEIGTNKGRIEVEANTRSQAASIASKAGYSVRDVNMVG